MIRQEKINGHDALILENDLLQITVLPRKGADIYEFIHKPSGVDFLLKTPAGLRPPAEHAPTDFLCNYEGGWQELFPNTDAFCPYKKGTMPFHGEVALLAWDYALERDGDGETSVRFKVRCRLSPFELQRLMRLPDHESVLEIEETVINHADESAEFVWGHHLVLGGNFLEAGCCLDVPARELVTRNELSEPATARLVPGQRERWPLARGRQGNEWFDLSVIDGPDAFSHDEILVTDLTEGRFTVSNPRLKLKFSLFWDTKIFPCIVLWQPFGGASEQPLIGIYGLGIEPWVSGYDLARSAAQGQSIKLKAREQLTTTLLTRVEAEGMGGVN